MAPQPGYSVDDTGLVRPQRADVPEEEGSILPGIEIKGIGALFVLLAAFQQRLVLFVNLLGALGLKVRLASVRK